MEEYGAATGRPRRVGPFDAVASRYGLKCQNADQIALTKLDVLSSLKEIPLIIAYQKGDQRITEFDPTEDMDNCIPVIEMVPGWRKIFPAAVLMKNFRKMPETISKHWNAF